MNHRRLSACFAVLFSLALLLPVATRAATPRDEQQTKLVVLIVIDQLRADFLFRWSTQFTQHGFNRLIQRGAYYENAYYTYGSSATAPGHASIASGRLPRDHGIVGNKWFAPPDLTKVQYIVNDPRVEIIGLPDGSDVGGKSPWRFNGSSIGDQLKLADRRSRVFSVAIKDRAAIFMGGKNPDGVFWWNKSSGLVVSSTYYAKQLPPYITEFNAQHPTDAYAGKAWERLLPPSAYAGTYPLKAEWHETLQAFGDHFPHRFPAANDKNYYPLVYSSPFGNELVLAAARRILAGEKLGRGPAPDMLCIGLSANDYTGHAFGPDSEELMDMTIRTDRQLTDFLNLLDETIGLDHCLIALTADHGVTSSPFVSNQLGTGAGFVDLKQLTKELDALLRTELGDRAPDHALVLGINLPFVYCHPRFEELDREMDGELTRGVLAHLKTCAGVERVFTAAELSGHCPSPDETDRYLAWRCFNSERSGQFYLRLSPFWYKRSDNIAGHTAGFRSDRHVPIILCGPGVRPGRHFIEADPLDIAPTLSALLGIQAPMNAVGHVRHEALDIHAR